MMSLLFSFFLMQILAEKYSLALEGLAFIEGGYCL
jgi:hypothetical protein